MVAHNLKCLFRFGAAEGSNRTGEILSLLSFALFPSCKYSIVGINSRRSTDISSHYQVVYQIDDACHGRIGAALVRLRRREVD